MFFTSWKILLINLVHLGGGRSGPSAGRACGLSCGVLCLVADLFVDLLGGFVRQAADRIQRSVLQVTGHIVEDPCSRSIWLPAELVV